MRPPRAALSSLLFATTFLVALLAFTPARAFCRTVTAAPPADYNPLTDGCFAPEGSKVLYWKNACVGFSLQKDASAQVSLGQATAVVEQAFAAWSNLSCPAGGAPSLNAVNEGPVECGAVQYNSDRPNQHVIVFRDDAWPYDDPNNTLGLTTVRYDTTTGEIYDADMEINSAQHVLAVGDDAPPGSYDLATIVTHEAGHFLGLAHSPDVSAIMFAQYPSGTPGLAADDVDGVCTIYPGDGSRVTSQGALSSDGCDSTPRHGFASACDAPPIDSPSPKGGCSVAGPRRVDLPSPLFLLALALFTGRLRRRGVGALVSSLAIAASVLIALPAAASVAIAVLFDELVHDAAAVAIITPVERLARWEDGRIATYTRVSVEQRVAGELAADPWIRTLGGEIGAVGELVEGEAVLTVGKPCLLFLEPAAAAGSAVAGIYEVTARAQGQFPITTEAGRPPRLLAPPALGMLVPPSAERVARLARIAGKASGASTVVPLARQILDQRLVDDAVLEIRLAWPRAHGG